ncbi:MAG: hypothetical protein IKO87_04060 [Kiritimatiellae bacterium]|nr:hypothetical protein [Kiritimatiellia bacterium]MBR4476689.1 hypothetical protein [Kiritimatiellia bacterium]
MKLRNCVFAAVAALVTAGCSSFHQTQLVKFVDDDGRFLEVVYGYGDEDHVTKWVSPATGKTIELKSRLRVKVKMEGGPSFKAFQCMNTLGSGTMYRTDNERWMYLANGFTCAVFEWDEERKDYRYVFQGVLCQTPEDAEGGK